MASGTDPPLFLYDGACGFCRKWASWLEKRVGSSVRFASFQDREDDPAQYTLTDNELTSASYLIENGRPYRGGRGFARAMARGRGVWKLVGVLLDLPLVRLATAITYRWVARNRHRLPGPGS